MNNKIQSKALIDDENIEIYSININKFYFLNFHFVYINCKKNHKLPEKCENEKRLSKEGK